MPLRNLFYFSLSLVCSLPALCQQAKERPAATVKITVTDSRHVPLKSQEVVFTNAQQHARLSARTDASGNCSVMLPAGATYAIRLRTLTDTVDYTSLDIPALQPGQFFTAPFTVAIEYEPARTFTLNHVYFDTGLPALRPDSFKELNQIAEYMLLKENEQYEISGHTDNVGKEEDNLKLSQKRAESVKAYLVKKGVDAHRLTARGYGASSPVADNGTPGGRQKNRRTEVMILQ